MNAPVDLLAVARDLYVEAGLPTNVHIDLTYRCDLDCVHCYLDNKRDWPELTTAEAENVLDQLRAMQVMELTWSGGEIFARPDFLPLLARASRMGFRNIVKTHGGSLTPERCAALADAFVVYLSVSLYSLDPEIHDGITTKPGSLQATLDGLQLDARTCAELLVSSIDGIKKTGPSNALFRRKVTALASIFLEAIVARSSSQGRAGS